MDARTLRTYTERATANVGRVGPLWWLIATVLLAFVAFGVYALSVQIRQGHSVTGVSHSVFWGFYVVNFVFFIGISYGGAITSAILRLTNAKWRAPISRIAEGTALVTLLIGAASVLIDVGRPDRIPFLFMYARPGSPITWDWIAITTYLVGTVIFFLLPLIPDVATYRETAQPTGPRGRLYGLLSFGWRGTPAQEKALLRGIGIMAILIIPLAVSVHSVLAWLFALTVQAGWHSTLFAPLFVLAAMLSGVATVILVIAAARRAYALHEFITEKHFRYLTYLLVALDAAYLYFMFSEYLTEGYMQEEPMGHVLQLFFSGAYASWFWPFVIGGLILPIVLVTIPAPALVARSVAASILVVAGMWVKRFLIVILPGVAQPLMPWEVYKPTWVELGITLGLLAAIPLGLMILFALFPVMSVHEMEEVEGVSGRSILPVRRPVEVETLVAPGRSGWLPRLGGAGVALALVAAVAIVGGGPAKLAQGLVGTRVSLQTSSSTHAEGAHAAAPGMPEAPGTGAAATGGAMPMAAAITVEPSDDMTRGYVLQTRITKDTKPVPQVDVRFYEVVDLLGSREMLIGSRITDAGGQASVVYLPAELGHHDLVIRAAQGEQTVAETRGAFDAAVAAPLAYTPERLPLERFSVDLPLIAGGVLLIVWALFAFAFVGTARMVASGAREATAPARASRGVAGQARLEK
ncbi:MAG: polysulfide reductase NrfD [Chloroflexota bacterium]|nr:polysulfide reductase NrfD [Chloroflexota bacterium]MDE3193489.1 polysulfide reductase NrfD [Chloroflexota bacterium]